MILVQFLAQSITRVPLNWGTVGFSFFIVWRSVQGEVFGGKLEKALPWTLTEFALGDAAPPARALPYPAQVTVERWRVPKLKGFLVCRPAHVPNGLAALEADLLTASESERP